MVSGAAASANVTSPGPDALLQRTTPSAGGLSHSALPSDRSCRRGPPCDRRPPPRWAGTPGLCPESYTFHSRMPVESRPSETISRRSLSVRTSSKVVVLKALPATPRPRGFGTGMNSLPFQYSRRQDFGAPDALAVDPPVHVHLVGGDGLAPVVLHPLGIGRRPVAVGAVAIVGGVGRVVFALERGGLRCRRKCSGWWAWPPSPD